MSHDTNLFSMAVRCPDEIKLDEDNRLHSITKNVSISNDYGARSLLTISIRPEGSEEWLQEKPQKTLCMGVMGPYGMVSLGNSTEGEQGQGQATDERDPLGVGDSDVEWLEGFKRSMKHKEASLGLDNPRLPDVDVAARIRERDRKRRNQCLAEIRKRRICKMREMFDHFVLREHLKAKARRVARDQERQSRVASRQHSPANDTRLRSPHEDSTSPTIACIKQDSEFLDSLLVVDPLNTASDLI